MKKAITSFILSICLCTAYSQEEQWTPWQNMPDGWEKKLLGRKEIQNPYKPSPYTHYELQNKYGFLVFFTITLTGDDGEQGTWDWSLRPGDTKNWILKTKAIKDVKVSITKYKGADGNYYQVGESVNTTAGSFKLSYASQIALKDHYNLIENGSKLKKVFAASPFAFLFSGGAPRPDEVLQFPWVDFTNACKDLNNIIRKKIHDDAGQNCAQADGDDAKFWCKLAESYEKSE